MKVGSSPGGATSSSVAKKEKKEEETTSKEKAGDSQPASAKTKKKTNPRPPLALDAAFKKTKSGLGIYIEKHGTGPKIEKGQTVIVHYDGWLADGYAMFDSSRKKHRPFEFKVGEGQVIKGWDEALKDVKVGTKLQLRIPAGLAYGSTGVPALKIPPNATLLFKVEVLKAKEDKKSKAESSGTSVIV